MCMELATILNRQSHTRTQLPYADGHVSGIVEGTRRQSAYHGGQFWDRVYVSILADEYKVWAVRTGYWEE